MFRKAEFKPSFGMFLVLLGIHAANEKQGSLFFNISHEICHPISLESSRTLCSCLARTPSPHKAFMLCDHTYFWREGNNKTIGTRRRRLKRKINKYTCLENLLKCLIHYLKRILNSSLTAIFHLL